MLWWVMACVPAVQDTCVVSVMLDTQSEVSGRSWLVVVEELCLRWKTNNVIRPVQFRYQIMIFLISELLNKGTCSQL